MPIYEYRCKDCHQVFETWCKHIEDQSVPHNCPICKGAGERLISNTSFALKGSGWYATDYGSLKPDANAGKGADERKPAAAATAETPAKASCDSASGQAAPVSSTPPVIS